MNSSPAGGVIDSMSEILHSRMRVGDAVWLGPPSGTFTLPVRSTRPIVLLAAGIGITPFISLIETLMRVPGERPEVHLYYASRDGTAHAFGGRLRELQQGMPKLRLVTCFAHPLPGDVEGVDYDTRQRFDADMLPENLIVRRALFYMCGPTTMMKDLHQGLIRRGVPAFDLFQEVFRSPEALPVGGSGSWKVRFERSNREAVWTPKDGTLLTFGESLGIAIPNGCRVGQCESCEVGLSSGSVSHLHGVEPDATAHCFACQAIPLSDLTVDA
jgi:ferredoxin-NADP reductase